MTDGCLTECRLDALGRHGQLSQPDVSQLRHGIPDGRGNKRNRRLSDADRGIVARD